MKAIAPVLLTILLMQPVWADGGGDSYSFGGANPLNALNASEGQVAIMGVNHQVRWVNQGDLVRAQCGMRPVIVHGSTGFYAWTMPEQGQGYKKVIFRFEKYTSIKVSTINFPSPFMYPPAVTTGGLADVAGIDIESSCIKIPAMIDPFTGTVVLEGF